MTTHQKIGWTLLAISAIGAVVLPLVSGEPVYRRTYDGGDATLGQVHFHVSSGITLWSVALRLSIPVLLCGLAGILCLVWPRRNNSA